MKIMGKTRKKYTIKYLIISVIITLCFVLQGCKKKEYSKHDIKDSMKTTMDNGNIAFSESIHIDPDTNKFEKDNNEDIENIEEIEETENEDYGVERKDAKEYYEETGRIINIVNIDSSDMQTEKEICEDLKSRGFSINGLKTNYSSTGKYIGEEEITVPCDVKHPIYNGYYLSGSNILWVLSSTNGELYADPTIGILGLDNEESKLAEETWNYRILLSEKDTITGYDEDKYYIVKPGSPEKAEILVKKVDKIDAKTLDSLSTVKSIDNLPTINEE